MQFASGFFDLNTKIVYGVLIGLSYITPLIIDFTKFFGKTHRYANICDGGQSVVQRLASRDMLRKVIGYTSYYRKRYLTTREQIIVRRASIYLFLFYLRIKSIDIVLRAINSACAVFDIDFPMIEGEDCGCRLK